MRDFLEAAWFPLLLAFLGAAAQCSVNSLRAQRLAALVDRAQDNTEACIGVMNEANDAARKAIDVARDCLRRESQRVPQPQP